MTNKIESRKIYSTKRGFAAMWESGGGMTSGGSATIITGRKGETRRPVYVPRGGHLACGNHALITVHNGFYVIHASVSHGTRSSASIWKILSTSVKDIDGEKWEATAEMELINYFDKGEWNTVFDEKFKPAVEAAFRKASNYHCRRAMYIDSSERSEISEADKERRAKEMKRQDVERSAKRQAKADQEAREKAEREAVSKKAKEAGLGARLKDANKRLATIGQATIEINDTSFKYSWQNQLYTEENVAQVERQVAYLEKQLAEKERQRQTKEMFQPKFEFFSARAEKIGLKITFSDEKVKLGDDYYGHSYSDEGLTAFVEKLDQAERTTAKAKVEAEAKASYQAKKSFAAEKGLPTDISIWCRRGGRTNAGDGWVIGPDGQNRINTTWYNDNPRRLARYSEGDKIWEQILEGEVVLKWSKTCSAAPHEFEVVYLPEEELTEEQFERIAEIQDGLEKEWEGARGLASGIPSPSIGEGWGLIPKKRIKQKIAQNVEGVVDEQSVDTTLPTAESVAKLRSRFNRK